MDVESDFYDLLGVSPDAGDLEINAGYRRAANYWHPDRNPSREARRMMSLVNQAKQCLLDSTCRAEYNRTSVSFQRWSQEQSAKSATIRSDVNLYHLLDISRFSSDPEIVMGLQRLSERLEAARQILLNPTLRSVHDSQFFDQPEHTSKQRNHDQQPNASSSTGVVRRSSYSRVFWLLLFGAFVLLFVAGLLTTVYLAG